MLNVQTIAREGFKLLARITDEDRGLHAYFGMPEHSHHAALGGIRMLPYPSADEALEDAVRLSQAMLQKTSAAELDCGGAKLVVKVDVAADRNEVLSAISEFIEGLKGAYLAGPDMGVTGEDLKFMRTRTHWVACEADAALGSIAGYTAEGVFHGIRACLDMLDSPISGAHVAIQGAGEVGLRLAGMALAAGMKVTIADITAARTAQARALGCTIVSPAEITTVGCDVFSPCAKGLVITSDLARAMPARAICGSANNQVAAQAALDILAGRGIVYAPDYIVNAGGVIRGAEYYLHQLPDSHAGVAKIYGRTRAILNRGPV
jgi:glutamate dehydrogenase/leucine dehydrogenase